MPSKGNTPIDLKKSVDYASLKDRNVLVTGGASGLGKGFVHMFADNGANIVIADMNDKLGGEVEKELASKGVNVKFINVNVAQFDSQVKMLQQALAFFPRNEIDIFVPAAGILHLPTQIAPADPSELSNLSQPPKDMAASIIQVNLAGVYQGVMLVARYGMGLHKRAQENANGAISGGQTKSIVLIASLAGYCGAEGSVEYTTSKYGVRGLFRGLRKQLAGLGVRLNSVNPFYVDTPMTGHAIPVLKEIGIPIATVEHVTEAVARLATDEDAWGRAVFIMPEGLTDGGDDSAGGQGGKSFSLEGFGEHWAVLVNGPMSDEIPA